MPYADKEKQKEAQARWFREKYQHDKDFQEQEKARKADWLQTPGGTEKNYKASERARDKINPNRPRNYMQEKRLEARRKAWAAGNYPEEAAPPSSTHPQRKSTKRARRKKKTQAKASRPSS